MISLIRRVDWIFFLADFGRGGEPGLISGVGRLLVTAWVHGAVDHFEADLVWSARVILRVFGGSQIGCGVEGTSCYIFNFRFVSFAFKPISGVRGRRQPHTHSKASCPKCSQQRGTFWVLDRHAFPSSSRERVTDPQGGIRLAIRKY